MTSTHYKYPFLVFVVWLLYLSSLPAFAIEPFQTIKRADEHTATLVIAGVTAENPAVLHAGLQFTMAGKWKTYWRTPGDGGLPIKLNWDASENIAGLRLRWPAPKRYVQFGAIETYGYSEEILFPLEITPKDPSKPVALNLTMDYAICDEICIFENASINTIIPPGTFHPEAAARLSEAAMRLPQPIAQSPLSLSTPTLRGEHLEITATRADGSHFLKPDIFIEAGENFRFPQPEISFSEDNREATFRIAYETLLPTASLEDAQIKLTLVDKNLAAETTMRVANAPPLLWMLLLALFGGLILNIMPCVLPVLSLKMLSVIKHGGTDGSNVRVSFFVSALGILIFFLMLSGAMIALQATGQQAGWGLHFQQPVVVIFMILVLLVFVANVFGWWHLRTPDAVVKAADAAAPVKQPFTLRGHFFTGMFAALMATPCTAPVLGTAISFALAQSPAIIMLMFLAMGLGLALPYLLLAIRPGWVRHLPKPGPWMFAVKNTLGLLLLITVAWLGYILAGQLGEQAALAVAGLATLTLLLFWLNHRTQFLCCPIRKTITVLAMLGLFFYVPHKLGIEHANRVQETHGIWQPFNASAIPNLVTSGKTVFVDVTADWCITCQFNKLNVLNTENVLSALRAENVVAMKANFTNPDPAISAYLKANNRAGIPFNIVYGPAAPGGLPLSEILTTGAVLDAIKKAGSE